MNLEEMFGVNFSFSELLINAGLSLGNESESFYNFNPPALCYGKEKGIINTYELLNQEKKN